MEKSNLPEKYDPAAVERKWLTKWESEGRYHYSPVVARENTYVVDTPPPTVSGSLHIGHVFSYTQTDILARFQRMQGKNVFYPMGWDDNGLPTERRVQNLFGITCDPTLTYDPNFKPQLKDDPKDKRKQPISRRNFLEACATQTAEDEKRYEELWRHLGLSIDWRTQYATIDEHCRRISQLSFLDLVKKNLVYNTEAPTLWDTGFQTAVAQAEVEDRAKQGAFHDVRFYVEGGDEFVISTTRPELLAACIAVVAHPDDERYKKLFGKFAVTPLFRARVPILPAEHADPEKGTGILMICTFGDVHDVEFWKRSKLPLRQLIGRDGRFMPIRFEAKGLFESVEPDHANKHYDTLKGLYVNQARAKTVELLRADDSAALVGRGPALVRDPKPTEQAVKFYEKGDQPLEFISTRQWFVRILEHKDALLAQGRKVEWHPEHMHKRYEQWVEGLSQDWCISRQRYFGVAFPVWYPIDERGLIQYTKPIYAADDRLPVDPLADAPPGYSESQRGKPGGFAGDPDVMDTWATSSVSPQINSHWQVDPARHKALFPADLRPQAHEIIRTWAFYTITKAWMHEGTVPWKNIAISGWVVDPNREKMSKSKGNVVTPQALIEKYSSDAVRYWAGRAKLGQDTIYDESVFAIGKRLATKVFNASRFVMLQLASQPATSLAEITTPVDLAWMESLRALIERSSQNFKDYDYAQSLIETEQSFWEFCDNYLELIKTRSYQSGATPEGRSALATLEGSLKIFVRLLAPFLPYVCEEVWSWRYSGSGREASVHTATWPSIGELEVLARTDATVYATAAAVLTKVRGAKSSQAKSLKWPVERLKVSGSEAQLAKFRAASADITAASGAQNVELVTAPSDDLAIEVTLAATAQ